METPNPGVYLEKEFQAQAAEVLQKLGYILLSPEDCHRERGGRYHVLLKDILRTKLRELNVFEYGGVKYRFKPANIERAIDELNVSIDDAGGLIKASEKIYDALLLGRDMPETLADGRTLSFNLRYIDWENIEKMYSISHGSFQCPTQRGTAGRFPILCCSSMVSHSA